MSNFGIFVTANNTYLPYVNALFNSLEKRRIKDITVLFSYYDFPLKYIEHAKKTFSFNIEAVEIKREDYQIKNFNINYFMKQSKHKIIRDYGEKFDAICHIDADQFVVSENFVNLLELVKNTDKLIVPNEKYKWTFYERFVYKGKRIIEKDVKAYKFHCGSPSFMDVKKWTDVLDCYNKLAFNSFEIDKKKNINKPIGDMVCWNISVYKRNRQNDIILMPMECFTQVHYTNCLKGSRIIVDKDTWITENGDEVFAIHGRVGNEQFYKDHIDYAEKTEVHKTEIILKKIQK